MIIEHSGKDNQITTTWTNWREPSFVVNCECGVWEEGKGFGTDYAIRKQLNEWVNYSGKWYCCLECAVCFDYLIVKKTMGIRYAYNLLKNSIKFYFRVKILWIVNYIIIVLSSIEEVKYVLKKG